MIKVEILNKIIDSEHYYRLREISKLKDENIKEKLIDFISQVKPRVKRTGSQNRALHKDCEIIAQKLNDAGYDMRAEVWKFNLPWTTTSVKDELWKNFQKRLTGKDSTTKLEKHGEIEDIHKTLMRELGEKLGIEYHEFPFDPKKRKEFEEMQSGYKDVENYPENNLGEPKF